MWQNADSLQRCPEIFLFKFPTRSQEFSQWQVSKTAPEASPSAGLFRLSLVIACFCFAVHVAASFLQLGAFCLPRIYPLWSVPVSGSFFYAGDLQASFTWVRNMFLMSYCWYLKHLEILWSILEDSSYYSKWHFQQVLLSLSLCFLLWSRVFSLVVKLAFIYSLFVCLPQYHQMLVTGFCRTPPSFLSEEQEA